MTTMQQRAAKVADDEAQRLVDLAKKAPNPEAEMQTLGRSRTAALIAADIRALPADPDPTRAECVTMPEWAALSHKARALMIKAAFGLVSGKDHPGAREWYHATRLALKTYGPNALGGNDGK